MAAQEEVALKTAVGIDPKVEIDPRPNKQRNRHVESHIRQFLQEMRTDYQLNEK
jgi:hypothetical protein